MSIVHISADGILYSRLSLSEIWKSFFTPFVNNKYQSISHNDTMRKELLSSPFLRGYDLSNITELVSAEAQTVTHGAIIRTMTPGSQKNEKI